MAKKTQKTDPVQRDLDAVKRLLILLLIKAGTPQSEIAKALGMDQGNLSRMMPKQHFKLFRSKEE